MKVFLPIKALILAYNLFLPISENLHAYEKEVKISLRQVRPGNSLQSQLIKAFEAYNINIRTENNVLLERYEREIRSEALSAMRYSYCHVYREMTPKPKSGCIYFVEIQPLDFRYERTYNDQDAYFRFNNKVELATGSKMYFHFEYTGQMLSNTFGNKYKLYDVNAFGSAEEVYPFFIQIEKKNLPPPPLQEELSQSDYISKIKAVGTVTSRGPDRSDFKCLECKGTGKFLNFDDDRYDQCRKCSGEKTVIGNFKYIVSQ